MKIINLVLNNFTNDSRVLKTTKSLQKLDHEVLVVALHEEGLDEFEAIKGVDVHRIKLTSRGWSKNKFIQAVKLTEFIVRFVSNYREYEVIHCNDLDGLLVGVLCKFTRWKIKLVYDSHEFAINDVPYQSAHSIKIKYYLEKSLIRFADQVICVSDSIANEYAKLYEINKPHLVLNCPNYTEQPKYNIFRESLGIREDQKIFLYQGGLNKGRGIELLLEAFEGLENDNNVLVCMGYGILEGKIQQKSLSSKNIFFHKAVTPSILLNYTSSADYGISFIEDSCLSYRYCLPNKLFEYMMAGLPILTSNLPEMKHLVENESVGIVAKENIVESFKDAIENSLKQKYAVIRANVYTARKKYCWEEQEKVLFKVYENI